MQRAAYPSLDEIDSTIDHWVATLPDWVHRTVIGHSLNGRPIWLVTLGDRRSPPDHRPAFWLDAGTHCAEWAGMASHF